MANDTLRQRTNRMAETRDGSPTLLLDQARKKRLSRSDPTVLHPDPFVHHPNPLGCHLFGKKHPTFDLGQIRQYQPRPVEPYSRSTSSYGMDLGRLHSSNSFPVQLTRGSPRVGINNNDDSVINSATKQTPARNRQISSHAPLRRSLTTPLTLLDRTVAVVSRCRISLSKVPLSQSMYGSSA